MSTWPLPQLPDGRLPVISSGFGPRRGTPPHAGADCDYRAIASDPKWPGRDTNARTRHFYMPDGVPALAFADGVVVQAAVKPRINGDVWLHHPQVKLPDGTTLVTRYAHLRDIRVRVGDLVTEGLPLATVFHGVTPFRHLHFAALRAGHRGSYFDPAPLLAVAEVRSMSGVTVRRPRGRTPAIPSDGEPKGATSWLTLMLLLVAFTKR